MNFNYTGIQGFDISFWQDDNRTPQKTDFAKMKAWGADFVIVRAGQNLWQDEDFADNWRAAKEAGLPRAAYWFYDPRISPERQAAFYAGLFVNDKPEGRLWVDLEFPLEWGGAYRDWWNWRAFIEELKKLSGLRVGIYTANWWWQPNAVEKGADVNYFGQYPLWVAQYTSSPANVTIPSGWSKAMLWQDGTPAIGHEVGVESEEIDHNYWNSDFDFATEWQQDPSGGTNMQYKVVWPNGAAKRTAPSVSNSYTGLTIGYEMVVDVIEDNLPDRDDPANVNKIWVKLAETWNGNPLYAASQYPRSDGTPAVRMVKIDEPAKEIAKAVLYADDGSVITELYPL